MNPELERIQQLTRRSFLKTAGQFSLGAIALASMMGRGIASAVGAAANPLAPVFMTAALIAAAGFLVVLFLEERPLRQRGEREPGARVTSSANINSNKGSTHVHA